MNYISYSRMMTIRPENIRVNIDKHFFEHHGRSKEEFMNLIDYAKMIPEINKKKVLNIPLTEDEKYAENIFLREDAMRLTVEQDGAITAVDGRHRLFALKVAEILIQTKVAAYLTVEPVVDVTQVRNMRLAGSDANEKAPEKKSKKGFFRRFRRMPEKEITPEIKYMVAETTEKEFRGICKKGYALLPLKSAAGKDFVLISAKEINGPREFEITAGELKAHNIQVSYTKDNFFR